MAKINVYVDDAVWASFKMQVFLKHGNLRKLSNEVERLIKDAPAEIQILSAFEKLGINAKGTVSSQEIKATRPKLKGPLSEEILKEMRHKRVAQTLS